MKLIRNISFTLAALGALAFGSSPLALYHCQQIPNTDIATNLAAYLFAYGFMAMGIFGVIALQIDQLIFAREMEEIRANRIY